MAQRRSPNETTPPPSKESRRVFHRFGQRIETWFRSPSLFVGHSRCDLDQPLKQSKWIPLPLVSVSVKGMYLKRLGRREFVGDANHMLFFNPNEEFESVHPIGGGDEAVFIAVDRDLALETAMLFDPSAADRPDRPFDRHAIPLPSSQFLRHVTLWKTLTDDSAEDRLATMEEAVGLYARVVAESYETVPSPPVTGEGARSRSRAVRRVQEVVSARYEEPLSLQELAASAGYSVPYLCRTFRGLVGIPIHRYLNRLRLRRALPLVAEAGSDLTTIALDTGFDSHSHFTSVFRREFGKTPSAFRDCCCSGNVRDALTRLDRP